MDANNYSYKSQHISKKFKACHAVEATLNNVILKRDTDLLRSMEVPNSASISHVCTPAQPERQLSSILKDKKQDETLEQRITVPSELLSIFEADVEQTSQAKVDPEVELSHITTARMPGSDCEYLPEHGCVFEYAYDDDSESQGIFR